MNIAEFDLNLLVVFDAVLAESSISRAAERLDLSQPAVSNALARMRKATGDRLFVRLANAMVPTPYAQAIADPIRQALASTRKFCMRKVMRCSRPCSTSVRSMMP